jgi:hypothetical protein
VHKSLKTKTNARLLVAWTLGLCAVVAASTPVTWITVAIGSAFGLVGGILQLNAMRVSAVQLASATTLLEVRRGFSSSISGRTYLWEYWVSQITLLVVSVLTYQSRALVAMVVGYLSFALFRELVTIRGTRQLERLAGAQA